MLKIALKYFTSSVGSWITLILGIVQIVMALLYFYMDLPKIKTYIFSITKKYLSFFNYSKKENKSFPPKKNVKFKKRKNKKINEENNYLYNLRNISNNIINKNKSNKSRNEFDEKNSENKKIISFSTRKELNLTISENEIH